MDGPDVHDLEDDGDGPLTSRTITFEEVYQGGKAQYPHYIHSFHGHFYICKCEDSGHIVYFKDTLLGPAKHLNAAIHGNMPRSHKLAVKKLGYLVVDCDVEKMDINNLAFKVRRDEGYTPPNTVLAVYRPTKPHRASKVGESHRSSKQSAPFKGIINPIAGELYTCHWPTNNKAYVGMVLAWGDQVACGLPGTLATHGLIVPGKGARSNAPKCYTLSEDKQSIAGWAAGYEDNGKNIQKRYFPVMFFDKQRFGVDSQDLDGLLTVIRSLAWLEAKNLALFDADEPTPENIGTDFAAQARCHYARTRGFVDYPDLVAKGGKGTAGTGPHSRVPT